MGVTRQHQVLAHDGAFAGPPAAQPHLDVLLPRGVLRRPFLLEPAQPGHRGLQPGRHVGVVGGLLPQGADQLLQLLVLLVPAAAQLLEPADPVGAGLGVVPEAAAVHPDVPPRRSPRPRPIRPAPPRSAAARARRRAPSWPARPRPAGPRPPAPAAAKPKAAGHEPWV